MKINADDNSTDNKADRSANLAAMLSNIIGGIWRDIEAAGLTADFLAYAQDYLSAYPDGE